MKLLSYAKSEELPGSELRRPRVRNAALASSGSVQGDGNARWDIDESISLDLPNKLLARVWTLLLEEDSFIVSNRSERGPVFTLESALRTFPSCNPLNCRFSAPTSPAGAASFVGTPVCPICLSHSSLSDELASVNRIQLFPLRNSNK